MSGTTRHKRRRGERGGALVEVAIFSPLLMLLALGTVDYGRVVYQDIALERAALAGAQWGAQSSSASENLAGIKAAVVRDLGDGLSANGVATEAERYCACPDDSVIDCSSGSCSGNARPSVYVRVQVAKTFSTLIDYPGLPGELTLIRDAQVRAR